MSSPILTEAFLRYIGEQHDCILHREEYWQRLQTRIQNLPVELRMIILKDWLSDNPPKLVNGSLEHALITDTGAPPSRTEQLALFHSAPIILERTVERDPGNEWTYSELLFFLSMEWPSPHDPWLPWISPFDSHDKLCARQGRACIRIICRLVVLGSDVLTQRIAYNGSGQMTPKFKTCPADPRTPWLEAFHGRAEYWSHRIAARNGVPRENVELEVLFKHQCANKNCTGTHPVYKIPRVVWFALTAVVLLALAVLYQGVRIAVTGKSYWRVCCAYWAGCTEDMTTRMVLTVALVIPAVMVGTVLWIFGQMLVLGGWMVLLAGRALLRFSWGVLKEVQRQLAKKRIEEEKEEAGEVEEE